MPLLLVFALQDAKLQDLSWIAGSWEGKQGTAVFEEQWLAPAGQLMIGMGRLTKGDRTLFYEFLKLEETKEGIFYKVTLADQPEVAFKLTKLQDKEAVFENPEHDFPTKIVYRLDKELLIASIEGKQGGRAVREEFRFARKK